MRPLPRKRTPLNASTTHRIPAEKAVSRRPRASVRAAITALVILAGVPLTAWALVSTGPSSDKAWYWQNPLPQGNAIFAQDFADGSNGFLAGSSGVVLKTTDGGVSFDALDAGVSATLRGVSFVDAKTGWVAGSGGTVRQTTDGGSGWTARDITGAGAIAAIDFADATHGVAVGDTAAGDPALWSTSDGGGAWKAASTTSTAKIAAVAMRDAGHGFAAGARGVLLATADGGGTWDVIDTSTSADLTAVTAARTTRLGYAVGRSASGTTTILKTTDGSQWTALDVPGTPVDLFAVACDADGSTVVAAGADGTVLTSSDAGATWTTYRAEKLDGVALRSASVHPGGAITVAGDAGATLRTADGGKTWQTPTVPGRYAHVNAVRFVSATKGWAAGDSGLLLWTDDGGVTWRSLEAGVKTDIRALSMANATTGWLAGDAGVIRRTADSGTTWAAQDTGDATERLNALFAVDADHALAGGVEGRIRVTSDAGATWDTAALPTTQTVTSLWVAGNTAWATAARAKGDSAALFRSADGGRHWTSVSTPDATGTLSAVTFIDATTGFAAGDSATILKTTDAGVSWTRLGTPANPALPGGYDLTAIHFADARNGWAAGTGGTIVRTFDGGDTWVLQHSGTTTRDLRTVWASDGGHAWVGGEWGAILASTVPGAPLPDPVSPPSISDVTTSTADDGVKSLDFQSAGAQAPLPAPPAAVLARAPQAGYAFVDWQRVTDTTGTVSYRVWRSENGVDYAVIAEKPAAADATYIDSDLRGSTRYYYAVSTVDARGESSLSDTSAAAWDRTAPVTGPLPRPTGLSAVEGSASVLLTWSPVDNASVSGYVVSRSDRSLGSVTATIAVAAAAHPSVIDAGVVNGRAYFYTVAAIDGSGTVGSSSAERRAVPKAGSLYTDVHVVNPDGSSRTCDVCHSVHDAPTAPGAENPTILSVGGHNENTLCLGCHSTNSRLASTDTSAELNAADRVSGMPIWTENAPSNPLTCGTCHRPTTSETTPVAGLLRVNGVSSGNAVCYECHGPTTTIPRIGDLSGFEGSAHSAITTEVSGSSVTCLACHEPHASNNPGLTTYAAPMSCLTCHETPGADPARPDVWTSLTLAENTGAGATHPVTSAGQGSGASMSCQNCHDAHSVTAETPLTDPRNPGPGNAWTAARGSQTAFCLSCHGGATLPTAAQTAPWADAVTGAGGATVLPNIASGWGLSVHGEGVSSDASATAAGLRADMGYVPGATLECATCHDPHGSANALGLRASVKSSDGTTSSAGALVYTIPAGQLGLGSPQGYDLRFFCATCHDFDPASHDARTGADTTVLGATDCTSCHSHTAAGGGF